MYKKLIIIWHILFRFTFHLIPLKVNLQNDIYLLVLRITS